MSKMLRTFTYKAVGQSSKHHIQTFAKLQIGKAFRKNSIKSYWTDAIFDKQNKPKTKEKKRKKHIFRCTPVFGKKQFLVQLQLKLRL